MKFVKYLTISAVLGGVIVFTSAYAGFQHSNDEAFSSDKQLSGEINIDGSSTVYPIMEAVSEEYMLAQPNVKVTVGFSGTGGGFKKFIEGSIDLNNASRIVKEEEKTQLIDNGIKFTEMKLAYDGLSIVINKDNKWVDYLTIPELRKLWQETGKTKMWSDIRPGWPKEKVKFYAPGTDSGTYDYFDQVILENNPLVTDSVLSEDDNVLVDGIAKDKNAIGFFGYAYYKENKNHLKVVPIDGGNGPVEPNSKTIKSGEYQPLSRPLYTYISNQALHKEQVYDYTKFLIKHAANLSEEVGYVPLKEEDYKNDLKVLEHLKK